MEDKEVADRPWRPFFAMSSIVRFALCVDVTCLCISESFHVIHYCRYNLYLDKSTDSFYFVTGPVLFLAF